MLAARALFAAYLMVLALVVFLPSDEAEVVTGLVGWAADLVAGLGAPREPAAVAIEFAANIALFVPFGALMPIVVARATPSWTLAAGLLASVAIELVQIAIPSRVPTVSDVVANTIGTAVGLALIWTLARQRHPLDPAHSPT